MQKGGWGVDRSWGIRGVTSGLESAAMGCVSLGRARSMWSDKWGSGRLGSFACVMQVSLLSCRAWEKTIGSGGRGVRLVFRLSDLGTAGRF